ncbi:alpha/beta hydrolase [Amycolatopsis sp. NPDC051102]|uniref:alpha/beta hydrolase n=1 Tax=Amycolatopsis sp. NPDC051102 TaxID=3155163 RepID=UPI00342587A8
MSRHQRAEIDTMLRAQPKPPGPQAIEDMRAGFAAMMAGMVVPAGIRTTQSELGGRRALLVKPEGEPGDGVILYFHGGSFVLGAPETALSVTGNLVTRTGWAAYSLDYRLAPEHPFPAGIEDTVAAYRALLERGVDPSAIVFAGDSAGGGLTVTTCLRARAEGLPMPAALVAFSPGLDATRTGESMDTKAGIDPFFTRESFVPTSAMYLAGQDPHQELASPAVCADLSGFPPMLLQVGTNEVLLDDSTRLAARAWGAGVDVVLDVTADVPHVFQAFAGRLEEADQALDRAAFFLGQHVRRPADQAGQAKPASGASAVSR